MRASFPPGGGGGTADENAGEEEFGEGEGEDSRGSLLACVVEGVLLETPLLSLDPLLLVLLLLLLLLLLLPLLTELVPLIESMGFIGSDTEAAFAAAAAAAAVTTPSPTVGLDTSTGSEERVAMA